MRRRKSIKFKTQKIMKTLKVLFLCSAAFLLMTLQSPAQGLLLSPYDPGIGPPTPTDLAATQVRMSYSGGTFSAGGTAPPVLLSYIDPAGNSWGTSGTGTFTLTANIDSSGNLSSGSLNVSALFVENDPTLTATLMPGPQGSPAGSAPLGSAWDYVNGYNDDMSYAGISLLAFSFTVTGGTLADDFGGNGASGIIELNLNGNNPFDLATSYSNGGDYGTADIIPVPEPTTAGCFLLGLSALACFRRFTQNRRS
jgi:hypothetical protein